MDQDYGRQAQWAAAKREFEAMLRARGDPKSVPLARGGEMLSHPSQRIQSNRLEASLYLTPQQKKLRESYLDTSSMYRAEALVPNPDAMSDLKILGESYVDVLEREGRMEKLDRLMRGR